MPKDLEKTVFRMISIFVHHTKNKHSLYNYIFTISNTHNNKKAIKIIKNMFVRSYHNIIIQIIKMYP